jgi:hypothetical protein
LADYPALKAFKLRRQVKMTIITENALFWITPGILRTFLCMQW